MRAVRGMRHLVERFLLARRAVQAVVAILEHQVLRVEVVVHATQLGLEGVDRGDALKERVLDHLRLCRHLFALHVELLLDVIDNLVELFQRLCNDSLRAREHG